MNALFWFFACSSTTVLKEHNTAPTVNIYSHENDMELTIGSTELFVANVVDLNDSVDSLVVEWTYGPNQVCTEAIVDRNNDVSCELEIIPDITQVKIVVRDSSNAVGEDILEFSLFQNVPPTAPLLEISPVAPTSVDEVTVLATASDPNGDTLSYEYNWVLVEAPDIAVSSTNQLSAVHTERGQQWQVSAIPFDGLEYGPSSTLNFSIGNAAPVIDMVEIAPSTEVYNDSELTCSATASDPDSNEDLVSLTYRWLNNGTELGQSEELSLDSSIAAPGDAIICQVTVEDSEGLSTMAQASVEIGNREFVVHSSSLTPSSPTVSDTLELTIDVTDIDDQPLQIAYAWSVNSNAVAESTNLLSPQFFRGDIVDVQATIEDGEFTSIVSETVTIVNSVPTVPTITTTPSAPIEGQDDLICEVDTPSTDADGDGLNYQVVWTKNGSTYGGNTTTTYIADDTIPASDISLNDVWECTLLVDDGIDSVTSTTEAFTTVNGYCSVYVSQTCYTTTTHTAYGRHASCGVNPGCTWCCQQDYIDPDCEGWCTGNCPNWHAEYYNECTYTYTEQTPYDCSYTTTQLCN